MKLLLQSTIIKYIQALDQRYLFISLWSSSLRICNAIGTALVYPERKESLVSSKLFQKVSKTERGACTDLLINDFFIKRNFYVYFTIVYRISASKF